MLLSKQPLPFFLVGKQAATFLMDHQVALAEILQFSAEQYSADIIKELGFWRGGSIGISEFVSLHVMAHLVIAALPMNTVELMVHLRVLPKLCS